MRQAGRNDAAVPRGQAVFAFRLQGDLTAADEHEIELGLMTGQRRRHPGPAGTNRPRPRHTRENQGRRQPQCAQGPTKEDLQHPGVGFCEPVAGASFMWW